MAEYCGVECQRADWDLHKLDCKKMAEDRREYILFDRVHGGGGKAMRAALLGWYQTMPHVMLEVLCLAWRQGL
jgi:hypothetical protein